MFQNFLVDINHPAHVHLFRELIFGLKEKGKKVVITVKDIPSARLLLEKYNLPYILLGEKKDTMHGKFFRQLQYNKRLYDIVKAEKIDIGIGSSITIAHVSRLTGMKSFVFDDDDSKVQPLMVRFGHPFAHYLVTPDCLTFENYGEKQIVYPGYHELAYLHPKRFTPDPAVLQDLGVQQGEKYYILRFNAFKAHHDGGMRGISLEGKIALVNLLSRYGKVFITAERDIEPEIQQYALRVSPERIHSVLYYASLFAGDSQTMTTEAALLGTPAFKCNSFSGNLSIPNEVEHRYRLCQSFSVEKEKEFIKTIEDHINIPDAKAVWQERLISFYKDKIDVSSFFTWFFLNYPNTLNEIKSGRISFERFK